MIKPGILTVDDDPSFLKSALRLSSLTRENKLLNEALREKCDFEGFIGSSRSFREVLDRGKEGGL